MDLLKKLEMKHRKKSEKSKNTIYILVIILSILFFFMKTKQKLINYPNEFILYGILILFCVLILFNYNQLKKCKNVIEVGFVFLKYFFYSIGLTLVVFTPFNYYLISGSKKSKIEVLTLPLVKVSTHSQNRCFFYSYKEEKYVYYDYDSKFEEILKNENYDDYRVRFQVKKCYLNTLIIIDWILIEN